MIEENKVVLVVNDDERLCKMLAYLFRAEGFEVANVRKVIDAIETFEEDMPDIIILNIKPAVLDSINPSKGTKGGILKEKKRVAVLLLTPHREEVLSLGAYNVFESTSISTGLVPKIKEALETKYRGVNYVRSSPYLYKKKA